MRVPVGWPAPGPPHFESVGAPQAQPLCWVREWRGGSLNLISSPWKEQRTTHCWCPLPGGDTLLYQEAQWHKDQGHLLQFPWELRQSSYSHTCFRTTSWGRAINPAGFMTLGRCHSEELEALGTTVLFVFKAGLRGGRRGCRFRSEALRVGTGPPSLIRWRYLTGHWAIQRPNKEGERNFVCSRQPFAEGS